MVVEVTNEVTHEGADDGADADADADVMGPGFRSLGSFRNIQR